MFLVKKTHIFDRCFKDVTKHFFQKAKSRCVRSSKGIKTYGIFQPLKFKFSITESVYWSYFDHHSYSMCLDVADLKQLDLLNINTDFR